MDPLDDVENAINYKFFNRRLLQDALTHPSYMNEHGAPERNRNARLAFLGDALLSLAVANDILREEPPRGNPTLKRAEWVSNKRLAELARGLHFPLRLGLGEKKNDLGEEKRLADAFEAVAGAVFLDAGPAHAITVVRHLLSGGRGGSDE